LTVCTETRTFSSNLPGPEIKEVRPFDVSIEEGRQFLKGEDAEITKTYRCPPKCLPKSLQEGQCQD
jgi:hypothetical protein